MFSWMVSMQQYLQESELFSCTAVRRTPPPLHEWGCTGIRRSGSPNENRQKGIRADSLGRFFLLLWSP